MSSERSVFMRNYILKIKDIRISKGFSQKYMADQLNISQQMYSKLEKHDRNITLENLIKISELLEVTPNDLIEFFESHDEYIKMLKNL